MPDKKPYIATLLGGEHNFEVDWERRNPLDRGRDFLLDQVHELVRKLKITTPRSKPQPISIKVEVVEVVPVKEGAGWETKRRKVADYQVTPPLSAMTGDEYHKAMDELLAPLPKEFHPFINRRAWDDGHSAGYEEVVNIAHNLVDELLPSVRAYEQKLKGYTTV